MVNLNCIHQKACVIKLNHETYNIEQQFMTQITFLRPYKNKFNFFTKFCFQLLFLDFILMILLNINNQSTSN